MVPIFEQGQGQGIGHSFESFIRKFTDICEHHLNSRRARAFAFILYDFQDNQVKEILKNQGGFTRLDRLSGRDLSVFYLHSDNRCLLQTFNNIFLGAFEIQKSIDLPFVLFFKVVDGEVSDIQIVELEQSNLIFAFEELYSIIDKYINTTNEQPKTQLNKLTKFAKRVTKISVDKLIKWVMDKGLEQADKIF
jgi:hypothetical protein